MRRRHRGRLGLDYDQITPFLEASPRWSPSKTTRQDRIEHLMNGERGFLHYTKPIRTATTVHGRVSSGRALSGGDTPWTNSRKRIAGADGRMAAGLSRGQAEQPSTLMEGEAGRPQRVLAQRRWRFVEVLRTAQGESPLARSALQFSTGTDGRGVSSRPGQGARLTTLWPAPTKVRGYCAGKTARVFVSIPSAN